MRTGSASSFIDWYGHSRPHIRQTSDTEISPAQRVEAPEQVFDSHRELRRQTLPPSRNRASTDHDTYHRNGHMITAGTDKAGHSNGRTANDIDNAQQHMPYQPGSLINTRA